MNGQSPTSFRAAREELEDLWRLRLEGANRRFEAASAHYIRLLKEAPETSAFEGGSPLARAHRARSEAQTEYMRLLRIFTDLTITGRIPEEPAQQVWSR